MARGCIVNVVGDQTIYKLCIIYELYTTYSETTCLASAGYQILIPGYAALQAFLIPIKFFIEIEDMSCLHLVMGISLLFMDCIAVYKTA